MRLTKNATVFKYVVIKNTNSKYCYGYWRTFYKTTANAKTTAQVEPEEKKILYEKTKNK